MINRNRKRRFTEADNYGWVVESWEAQKAYDLFCEYIDEDEVNRAIVKSLSNDELASSLAYLFHEYDFREWNRYKDEDNYEESINRHRPSKSIRRESAYGRRNHFMKKK